MFVDLMGKNDRCLSREVVLGWSNCMLQEYKPLVNSLPCSSIMELTIIKTFTNVFNISNTKCFKFFSVPEVVFPGLLE